MAFEEISLLTGTKDNCERYVINNFFEDLISEKEYKFWNEIDSSSSEYCSETVWNILSDNKSDVRIVENEIKAFKIYSLLEHDCSITLITSPNKSDCYKYWAYNMVKPYLEDQEYDLLKEMGLSKLSDIWNPDNFEAADDMMMESPVTYIVIEHELDTSYQAIYDRIFLESTK